MGTGISMSSVNKIKELAASGDYSLALDILEHQDLTRSLSPQFIKICGEVYYENGRYAEARAALVKAHSMAPIGNKIIYSLIKVYLSAGYYSLVDTYYDIYKFNQNEKDAGTYRIEYMIAKSKRRPVKELYGILISANEVETDAAWDFEMLLLYAAMKNMDRLRSEAEIFRATYKGSSYIEKVNQIEDGTYDIENAVYCYPASEQKDDSEEQESTRAFEKKVLEADHLRMFPKDPKITLMVDDREPVPNSVKFKQMLLKSKEKKELKKQQKKEQQEKEQQEDGQEKEKRFHIGRMSKKEEAAFEEAIAENEKLQPDKDKLLDEVMSAEEKTDSSQPEETEEKLEEREEAVINEEKNLDQISEESFDESLDDFDTSDITDDFDTVLMVDPDALEQSGSEPDSDEINSIPDAGEEPENIEPDVEADSADDIENVEETEKTEPVAETDIEEAEKADKAESATEPDVDEIEKTESMAETDAEEADKAESAIESDTEETGSEQETEPVAEEAEYAEPSDPQETAEAAEAAENAECLDEENEMVLSEDTSMNAGASDLETEDQKFDIDVAIQSLDEYKFDTDDWEDDSFEQAYEDDDIVEIPDIPEEMMTDEPDEIGVQVKTEAEQSDEPETDAEIKENDEAEADETGEETDGPEADVILEASGELEADFKDDDKEVPEPSEISDFMPETVVDTMEESFDESVPEQLDESASEVISEQDFETELINADEEKITTDTVSEKPADANRKLDFPTFRSSLFPDYNSGRPPVVEHVKHEDIQKEYDQKMSENLKKEEALISETDELLARLGIELGTKYASNTDYFNMHQNSFVLDTDEELAETNQSEEKQTDIVSESRPEKKPDAKPSDEKKYKLKKR